MTRDDLCREPVLVETPMGRWPRFCIDGAHAPGTEHHLRYDGATVAWTHGPARVRLYPASAGNQPALV